LIVNSSTRINQEKARKLVAANQASASDLPALLHETDPDILATLLRNHNLEEEHLLVLLKRRDLPPEIPTLIHKRHFQHPSRPLLLALAGNNATSGHLLRQLLPLLRLFELVNLCYLPGVTPDQRMAAERTILQRLPTTPLGNKMTLARRATPTVVAELLQEGDPATFEICLNSPRLKEAAVFQFLKSARANAATLSMVARHSRWNQRPNLRMAILKNSRCPDIWFHLWLPKLTVATLHQLLAGRQLPASQKKLLQQQLKLRGG
jgi:hypothetical protein